MKVWVIAAIIFLNIILQSSVLPFLQIAGTAPDTLMMLVVSFALLSGSTTGCMTGLFGGLVQDVLYSGTLGLNSVIYMLIGYLIGLIHDKVFMGRIILPVFFVSCGSVLKGLMMLVVLYFMRSGMPFHYGFTTVILPETIYTAVFMPLVFLLISLLYNNRFMHRKWHFRRK